jgi:hypothetical protein
MYISLGHVGGYFGIQVGHVTKSTGRLVISRTGRFGRERSSRPRSIKVLYKTRLLPIR